MMMATAPCTGAMSAPPMTPAPAPKTQAATTTTPGAMTTAPTVRPSRVGGLEEGDVWVGGWGTSVCVVGMGVPQHSSQH